ncbi:MAG TPA: hypothetical protein VFJ58_16860 [Armatimonadota bacterium]|nr:hypothetical protein [Armatimonadota bacterium]
MRVLVDTSVWSLALLMCALAVRKELSIFTTDGDFDLFAEHLPVSLHKNPVD